MPGERTPLSSDERLLSSEGKIGVNIYFAPPLLADSRAQEIRDLTNASQSELIAANIFQLLQETLAENIELLESTPDIPVSRKQFTILVERALRNAFSIRVDLIQNQTGVGISMSKLIRTGMNANLLLDVDYNCQLVRNYRMARIRQIPEEKRPGGIIRKGRLPL